MYMYTRYNILTTILCIIIRYTVSKNNKYNSFGFGGIKRPF